MEKIIGRNINVKKASRFDIVAKKFFVENHGGIERGQAGDGKRQRE